MKAVGHGPGAKMVSQQYKNAFENINQICLDFEILCKAAKQKLSC